MPYNVREALKSYYEIYFEINSAYDNLAKIYGMSPATLFVLHAIYTNQPHCTQRLICDLTCYPKQTVNTILKAFEKDGYIQKQVADFDKRNKYLFLTDSGWDYAGGAISAMINMEETAILSMTNEERNGMLMGERAFLTQLNKFVASLKR